MNTLVIPQYEAELESLRNDLRKLLKLYHQQGEIVEALSAAVLQLRDKLSLPTDAAESGEAQLADTPGPPSEHSSGQHES